MLTTKARVIAGGALLGALTFGLASGLTAAEVHHYRLGYDQPHTTAYGVAADIFEGKLKELSGGTMLIDQFPGAQLGQEPQMLQLVKAGDIDFIISSVANASTLAPEVGVMSVHFLFRSEDHLQRAVADPRVFAAVRETIEDRVTGAHVLTMLTMGLRNMYGKKEVHRLEDIKSEKVRVQATPTEDTMFPAYGAQTVHMPFGSVYTSLQTGVVDFAENGVNVYQMNKHYEVAPVLSMTEHEANNNLLWVSDKLWSGLTDQQKSWVLAAAAEVGKNEPSKAIALEHESAKRLTAMGVKIVTDVDKSGFMKVATPIQDQIAKDLGPHAVKILEACRAVQ